MPRLRYTRVRELKLQGIVHRLRRGMLLPRPRVLLHSLRNTSNWPVSNMLSVVLHGVTELVCWTA